MAEVAILLEGCGEELEIVAHGNVPELNLILCCCCCCFFFFFLLLRGYDDGWYYFLQYIDLL
ncbi:hypothetical protein M6B38_126635 [Iris pallida]|uniref:Uncharacterized protein n=1 Tax=Iris pallida TaxID=29817 RepID=A0AAX6GGR2_IRIPA|nr:hypothetical protein M6B38_126635 [Iris pallida]